MRFLVLSILVIVAVKVSVGQVVGDSNIVDQVILDSVKIDSTAYLRPKLEKGRLVQHEDSIYSSTVAVQKKINKANCPDVVVGYRVQLFSCSGQGCQDDATKYYQQFSIAFPSISVYKKWEAPTIKVRAGDCRTRFEAEAIKQQIKKDFPYVFIVPDYIQTPYQVDCEDLKLSKSDSVLVNSVRNN